MEGLEFVWELPQLDPLPAHGSNHAEDPQALQVSDDRPDIFGDLPQLDLLPAIGSNHDDRFDGFENLPQFDPLPAVQSCSNTTLPAVGEKRVEVEEDTQQADFCDGLPSLPCVSCSCSDDSHLKPVVGGKSRRKRKELMAQELQKRPRFLSKSISWRSLPYLRKGALDDIPIVARIYGDDLRGLSGVAHGESFLGVREARELLEGNTASRWRHCLNKQGQLDILQPGTSVDFLEIFSGCGNLTLAAARQGLQVGPSIDKMPGLGHDNALSIDIKRASDRKLVWALVVVLRPRWIHCGFPCTFWVPIAHWTRVRDVEKNEADRMESLLYITFARQLVYYQASHRRHSSIENPKRSMAWDLDIVQDMLHAGNMSCVDTDLCAWGATDPYSGKFYQKTMRFACTFDCESMRRQCPKDHEHEIVQGHLQGGPFKGRLRSAISGQYPLPLCDAWASLAKRFI